MCRRLGHDRHHVMRRKLFNFATLTSLILFVAMCVMWVRSYTRAYVVGVSKSVWPSDDSCVFRCLSIRLVLGHWVVFWSRYDYDLTVPESVRWHHAMDLPTFRKEYSAGVRWNHSTSPVRLGPIFVGGRVINLAPDAYFLQSPLWHGFGKRDDPPRTFHGRTNMYHSAVAPAWPVAVALAMLPFLWVVQTARRSRRIRMGCCLTCGYDLRATPDRCPECGTAVKAKPQPAASSASDTTLRSGRIDSASIDSPPLCEPSYGRLRK